MKRKLFCVFVVFSLVFLGGCTYMKMHPPSIADENFEINATRFKTLYRKKSIRNVVISNSSAPPNDAEIYDISQLQNGNVIAWIHKMTLYVKATEECDITAPQDMQGFFSENENVTSIKIRNFDTSKTETMKKLFENCVKLKSVDFDFDMRSVTDISYMYANCSLMSSYDGKMSNTGNIRDISYMYLENRNLISYDFDFNYSSVTDAKGLFQDCNKLESVVFSTQTINIKNASNMFKGCTKLKSIDLTKVYTKNLTHAESMFEGCENLTALDISSFDTTSLEYAASMFSSCYNLASITVGSGWSLEKIKESEEMFYMDYSLPDFNPKYTDKTNAVIGENGYLSSSYN